MFQAQKTDENPDSLVRQTQPRENPQANQRASLISSDLSIRGDVHSDGPLIIDGQINGDVKSRSLTVKEGGTIEGNVSADEVTVFGNVFGTIQAREVKLRPTSHVEGDIFHEELEIEMGTNFSGTLTRTAYDEVIQLTDGQVA